MVTSNYNGKLNLNFSNKLVTCIQKLIQKIMVLLLTSFNSNIFNTAYGSELGTEIKNGLTRSELAFHYAASSISTIMDYFRLSKSDKPDENLVSIDIDNIELNNDTIDISFAIVTEAGKDYTFTIPIGNI